MDETQDLSSYSPCAWPGGQPLALGNVRLEPLDPARHAAGLWDVFASDDSLWTYMAYGPFRERGSFDAWLRDRSQTADPRHLTIVVDGRACGSLAYLSTRPEVGVVEIGHVMFGRALQRSRAATQALALAFGHVFDLGYRRVEWKCDAENMPSRRAAERLGLRFEGIFHQHMIVKGRNRDTAWYAVLDKDWPQLRLRLERWLASENFDSMGRQYRRLQDVEDV